MKSNCRATEERLLKEKDDVGINIESAFLEQLKENID